MLKAEEVLDEVLRRLGHAYERPLMYGGTADGVDLVLWYFHDFWALIVDRQEDLKTIREAQFSESGCGARNFSSHYREHIHQGCDELEAARYSVSQWRRIDAKLGLAVPTPRLHS